MADRCMICREGEIEETEVKDYTTYVAGIKMVLPVAIVGRCNLCGAVNYALRKDVLKGMNKELKHKLLVSLRSLEGTVGSLKRLYEEHPELNDLVDIQKIIPMSLDEWEAAIAGKVDEISAMPTVD